MRYTITQRTAVGGRRARDRADNADEFGIDRIRAGTDHSIAVPGHVDEFQVRRRRRARFPGCWPGRGCCPPRAFAMSPLAAYSSAARTPCLIVRLIVA